MFDPLIVYFCWRYSIIVSIKYNQELSDEENIKRIKDQGIFSNDPQTIMRAIDELERYGNRIIEDIEDIVAADYHDEVKRHGLEVIKRIKASN